MHASKAKTFCLCNLEDKLGNFYRISNENALESE